MRTVTSIKVRAELEASITRLLSTGPKTAREIERAVSLTRQVVNRRLAVMCTAGVIHPVATGKKAGPHAPRTWVLGIGPEAPPDANDKPRQVLTKASSIGAQRDPLVAALFGPARNAPRCIHCGTMQGTCHALDCRVARFV